MLSVECLTFMKLNKELTLGQLTNRDIYPYVSFNPDRNAEQQRILWKIPDISQKSENGGTYGLIRGCIDVPGGLNVSR